MKRVLSFIGIGMYIKQRVGGRISIGTVLPNIFILTMPLFKLSIFLFQEDISHCKSAVGIGL